MYLPELRDVPSLILPGVPTWPKPSWHLFVLRAPHRHELQRALEAPGMSTLSRYPVPLHRWWVYADAANNNGTLPVAGELASTFVSLPIGSRLGEVLAVRANEPVLDAC